MASKWKAREGMKVRALTVITEGGDNSPGDLDLTADRVREAIAAGNGIARSFIHAIPGQVGEVVHVEPQCDGEVFTVAWPRGFSCVTTMDAGEVEPVRRNRK